MGYLKLDIEALAGEIQLQLNFQLQPNLTKFLNQCYHSSKLPKTSTPSVPQRN
jgi:hypothetical protein